MAFDVSYSRTERAVHKLAFARPAVQLAAADIENTAFGRSFAGANAGRPVFVTSLARAGTTMVLEILAQMPDLASHIYRDMPFVLAPVLWSKLSGPFQKQSGRRERAHGDGVRIGFDSPESFEEVFWKAFWPDHYRDDGIRLWGAGDRNAEATEFFTGLRRKVVALRRPGTMGQARYVSKNNANIARLPLLAAMCPDAHVLVILRDPFEHAASLHRQHVNFANLIAQDAFVQRYMADIGHFEFGPLHRPFRFDGLAGLTDGRGPADADYWLAYWIAAFETVAAQIRDGVHVLPYEALCETGAPALAPYCAAIGIGTDPLGAAMGEVRPVAWKADPAGFDQGLAARARTLHAELSAAVLPPLSP